MGAKPLTDLERATAYEEWSNRQYGREGLRALPISVDALVASFAAVRAEAEEAGARRALEAAATWHDREAMIERQQATEYEWGMEDSRGCRHPAHGSARVCRDRADRHENYAKMIRSMSIKGILSPALLARGERGE